VIFFVQVRKRGPVLGVQAGAPIFIAGLGSVCSSSPDSKLLCAIKDEINFLMRTLVSRITSRVFLPEWFCFLLLGFVDVFFYLFTLKCVS